MRWPELLPGTAVRRGRAVARGSALLGIAISAAAAPGAARAQQALVPGPIMISDGAASAADKGGTSTATMVLANNGSLSEHLVGAACPAADRVALQPPPGLSPEEARAGLPLPRGTTVPMRPDGWHLSLSGLRVPLTAGEVIACSVQLGRSGERVVELTVAAPGKGG